MDFPVVVVARRERNLTGRFDRSIAVGVSGEEGNLLAAKGKLPRKKCRHLFGLSTKRKRRKSGLSPKKAAANIAFFLFFWAAQCE